MSIKTAKNIITSQKNSIFSKILMKVNFFREYQLLLRISTIFEKVNLYRKSRHNDFSFPLSLFHSLFRFLFLCPGARLLARVSWSLPLSLSFPGCSPANPSNMPVRRRCTDHQKKTHTGKHSFLYDRMILEPSNYDFWSQGSKTLWPDNFLKNHWF